MSDVMQRFYLELSNLMPEGCVSAREQQNLDRIRELEAERNECQRKATDAIMQNDAIARENDGLGKKVAALEAEVERLRGLAGFERATTMDLPTEAMGPQTCEYITHQAARIAALEAEVADVKAEFECACEIGDKEKERRVALEAEVEKAERRGAEQMREAAKKRLDQYAVNHANAWPNTKSDRKVGQLIGDQIAYCSTLVENVPLPGDET